MHLVKSLAVEHQMTRVYEQAHGAAMSHNLDLANAATRMTHTGSIAGMVLNLVLLLTCALASMRGDLNVSVVISVILLASRLMDPIQRAVFIYVQGRDRRAAFDKIVELDERTRLDEGSLPDGTFDALEELRADRLRLGDSAEPGAPSARQMPISLTLKAGDCIAVSSSSPALARRLMRALAGLDNEHQPDPALEGPSPARVMVNRLPLQDYSSADRNRIVGYVSADNRLFDGTIQDNITRFGEVSIPQAFEVAALFGIDRRLDELPGGIRTIVGDAAGGAIPPGLERQIAIMRAIVHRPRIILFDHAEQGLDRDSYADLVRFFSQVRGQATIVIASEDANLTAIADRIYHLDDQGLSLAEDLVLTQTPYRALVV
jgi:ATP-binding cassette subfamily C protein LapB